MANHTFYLIYENTPMKLLNNFLKSTLFLITVLCTPDVSLMLQFKLPSDIELIKIDLKEVPVNNLKVSFMNKENISAECQFEDRCEFSFNPRNNMYTVSLGFVMTHMILSFCTSNENKNYVILEFFYDNKLLGLDSKLTESKKLYYVDKFYFALDAFNEDEFKLKINIDDLRNQNAKHILGKFESGLHEKICKNEKLFDYSFFEMHAKFDTLHFFNHILCFEELRSCLSSLKSLQIISEDSQKLENLTGSYISTFFLEKYDEEFKEFSDDNLKTRKAFALFCKTHAAKLAKDVFFITYHK
ncbi:hypothetical protein NBO_364g0002 [Nosema bombycis CQ1]|uniref:Uncharacterized protein n=1 Tax=Nosema bombycis (strain CQ1 / CVCC 102059) TaxID=578461 RepID=R0KQ02_NOSB1|nr:hypothetical protein NBO_364g0002 [Nosema bombycis CQ1]|eukprot:EOB12796.1 hypothetical protein NBO_364g0002 [Nosema bombycis CQ1]